MACKFKNIQGNENINIHFWTYNSDYQKKLFKTIEMHFPSTVSWKISSDITLKKFKLFYWMHIHEIVLAIGVCCASVLEKKRRFIDFLLRWLERNWKAHFYVYIPMREFWIFMTEQTTFSLCWSLKAFI